MIHKHSDSNVINMVNYMANSSSGGFSFYSFCTTVGLNYWCWLHDDVYYCAIMLSQDAREDCVSDEVDKEQKQIDNGLLWPIRLLGSDNTSYVKRFRSKDSMLNWAFDVKKVDIDRIPDLLFYNS